MHGSMSSVLYLTAFLGAVTVALWVKRLKRRSLYSPGARLPGPPCDSWIAGNHSFLVQTENVGDMDIEWVRRYGLAFQMKDTFNKDLLYLADPKGMNYVLNTCGYTFQKLPFVCKLGRVITGPGIVGVEGDGHARQRKILLPGFSHGALKEFVPQFTHIAQNAAVLWRDLILESGQSSTMIDMQNWLSRILLDSIGHAVFSHEFGTLNNADNELRKAHHDAFVDTFHKPSNSQLAFMATLGFLPTWTIPVLLMLPIRARKKLTGFRRIAERVGRSILQRETQALEQGMPLGKDIMSILVRANRSEIPRSRLNDQELFAQMTALMLAGHNSTPSVLVWIFYELSRHPEIQAKLREEIKAARAASEAAGHDGLDVAEFESMEYTIAVIKETLRLYPPSAHNMRKAGRDEVIPLSTSLKTTSGHEITAIPVKEGQNVVLSFFAYNRIKSLWGEDADEWKPERFLENGLPSRPKGSFGVYANLATFSSGVHSCIGWRFAILQMQAVLVSLVENFEISPPPSELNIKIIRSSAPTLKPMVKGEEDRGPQMPLTITAVN